MTETAFLSARVPRATKRRIKEIAARRGVTVQDIVAQMAEEVIRRESPEAPTLAGVVARLRAARPALDRRGITHLHVFGSVVRGEAGAESDVDLAADFRTGTPRSLTDFVGIRDDLEDIVGHKVDLSTRGKMKPRVREALDREGIRVF